MNLFEHEIETGATFSPCRTWRYRLWRTWDERPAVNFVCLNPSKATETDDDPTVTRLQVRARKLGFGGLVVTNLFAFRATDPSDMKAAADPVGPDNDAAIIDSAKAAGMVVAAWGNHGQHRGRAASVRKMLEQAGVELHCLRVTKIGEPEHPLYLSYDLQPVNLYG